MKLASVPSQDRRNRNGDLLVVSSDNKRAVKVAPQLARNLLEALENWAEVEPQLQKISKDLNRGPVQGELAVFLDQCQAPLAVAPGFLDGSAFLSHVVRARKARGDVMPESARVTPLMYQGVSDNLLSWKAPISLGDVKFGGDFEGEFGVILRDTPRATKASDAGQYIALFTLFNDITLREIVKVELETKFGFLQSKPNSSFAPFVVTPDELGPLWDGNRLNVDLQIKLNGQLYGSPNGREMNFSFGELIAHACRTRPLGAGTILGCGTISNEDKARGFACLTEKRCQETIDSGKVSTPWLQPGDRVWMDVEVKGTSVFGVIDEVVTL
jgi:fumarylacetoacetate (FAA) hydrolase